MAQIAYAFALPKRVTCLDQTPDTLSISSFDQLAGDDLCLPAVPKCIDMLVNVVHMDLDSGELQASNKL